MVDTTRIFEDLEGLAVSFPRLFMKGTSRKLMVAFPMTGFFVGHTGHTTLSVFVLTACCPWVAFCGSKCHSLTGKTGHSWCGWTEPPTAAVGIGDLFVFFSLVMLWIWCINCETQSCSLKNNSDVYGQEGAPNHPQHFQFRNQPFRTRSRSREPWGVIATLNVYGKICS